MFLLQKLLRSVAAPVSVNMALINKPSKKVLNKYNAGLAARKRSNVGPRARITGGVEKVKFPVDGGPERAAAGQAGGPFLIAGLLPSAANAQTTASGIAAPMKCASTVVCVQARVGAARRAPVRVPMCAVCPPVANP